MITIRDAENRGRQERGWLDSRHTFSFGDYHDPRHMNFRALRVINEDRVRPGAGFPMHFHRDMEILTYVLDGALEHRDNLGHGSVIRPGEVQLMTAGTGVFHSEYNASNTEAVHFLQIWIAPTRMSLRPAYQQRAFPIAETPGQLVTVASHDGREGSLLLHQEATVYAGVLLPETPLRYQPGPDRRAWLQVARGGVLLNGTPMFAGDGAATRDEQRLSIAAMEPSEILLFDLA
jgi:redox-sensitive bicupin YhaK (pirin superfamily)